jgi:hypothetical protein
MIWIYQLPNWLLCVLVLTAIVGAALVGQVATRRLATRFFHQALEDHNEAAGAFIGAFGVFYGITLGLIAVASWENYDKLDDLVEREAAALGALDRDVSVMPAALGDELRPMLREYVAYLVERGWPAHRAGLMPEEGERRIADIHRRLAAFEPATERESVLMREALGQFNAWIGLRNERLESLDTGLPPILWFIVMAGAVLNIAMLYLIRIEPFRTHLLFTGMLSSFIGLMIFLIAALDHPFRGEMSIPPDAFETLLAGLRRGAPLP